MDNFTKAAQKLENHHKALKEDREKLNRGLLCYTNNAITIEAIFNDMGQNMFEILRDRKFYSFGEIKLPPGITMIEEGSISGIHVRIGKYLFLLENIKPYYYVKVVSIDRVEFGETITAPGSYDINTIMKHIPHDNKIKFMLDHIKSSNLTKTKIRAINNIVVAPYPQNIPKNHPMPYDVDIICADKSVVKIHSFALITQSTSLHNRLINTGTKMQITLDYAKEVVEWFVNSCYTGRYDFNEVQDRFAAYLMFIEIGLFDCGYIERYITWRNDELHRHFGFLN
ncbi:coiled coils domain protein [Faustovirus]|nr:coiled coils domain protein [Faustovirus]